jgi:hypothetical protein
MTALALVGSDWALIAALVPLALLGLVDIGLISIIGWLVRQLPTKGTE